MRSALLEPEGPGRPSLGVSRIRAGVFFLVVAFTACKTGSALDVSWRLIAAWPDAGSSGDAADAGQDASSAVSANSPVDCASANVAFVQVELRGAAREDAGIAQPAVVRQDCASGHTRITDVGTDTYTVVLTALDCTADGGAVLGVGTATGVLARNEEALKAESIDIAVTQLGASACEDAGVDGG